ncbi:PHB depolymerase family esterase [Kribbella qitaiheensis]|uniref:PHB depolymerase family esterase n=1 Tax=Kribbella qitaiheensis TaxID=1544730 RepID=A0A7G6XAG6_9ACTN|nr:PHB depolymerase family esterase [Kribbella qitaiheensis]
MTVLGFLILAAVGRAPAAAAASITEVTGFGTNPGNLRMFRYLPPGIGSGRPLVVALHGCTQSAQAYDDEPGWVELAQRWGFALLLPQQQSANNSSSCFNWFQTSDTARGAGEPLSIKQMVDRMVADQSSDTSRIFVTGLSAGGAMTAVMLATYPELFAGGAVVAGLPYRCASTLVEAFSCQSPGVNLTPSQWGAKVRAASAYSGLRPKVSIWHGASDSTVAYSNLNELMEQWTDVAGADQTVDLSDTVNGYPHNVYRTPDGRDAVETYSITGMSHGQPVYPGTGSQNCGTAAPYILSIGICAAGEIGRFWGLDNAGTPPPPSTTFAGVESEDGYVKAAADGSGATVGTSADLAIGRGVDGKENRALLSFDTGAIPDGASITRAWLTVRYAGGSGNPWADPTGNRLVVDVKTGCFDECATDAGDWSSASTAAASAAIAAFSMGSVSSTDFSPTGVAAINRSGRTQLRVRFERNPGSTAYRFLRSGPEITLSVTYAAAR